MNNATHSPKYETVLNFYERGLWDERRVRNSVNRWITEEEYSEITGTEY